jgi:hypothetical protein
VQPLESSPPLLLVYLTCEISSNDLLAVPPGYLSLEEILFSEGTSGFWTTRLARRGRHGPPLERERPLWREQEQLFQTSDR